MTDFIVVVISIITHSILLSNVIVDNEAMMLLVVWVEYNARHDILFLFVSVQIDNMEACS